MITPSAPDRYDSRNEQETRTAIERELTQLRALITDALLVNGAGLNLRAPNGTKYRVTVDNAGALVVTAL